MPVLALVTMRPEGMPLRLALVLFTSSSPMLRLMPLSTERDPTPICLTPSELRPSGLTASSDDTETRGLAMPASLRDLMSSELGSNFSTALDPLEARELPLDEAGSLSAATSGDGLVSTGGSISSGLMGVLMACFGGLGSRVGGRSTNIALTEPSCN